MSSPELVHQHELKDELEDELEDEDELELVHRHEDTGARPRRRPAGPLGSIPSPSPEASPAA